MHHRRVQILLDAEARTVAEESVTCMAVQEARHQHINSSGAVGIGNSCEIHQLSSIPRAPTRRPQSSHETLSPKTANTVNGIGARSDW